jgi:hypothetical protein
VTLQEGQFTAIENWDFLLAMKVRCGEHGFSRIDEKIQQTSSAALPGSTIS